MRAVQAQYGGWSGLYFIEIIIIGNFLLLNIFLSILLMNEHKEENPVEVKEQIAIKENNSTII
jgi:hypothetical protein